MATASSSKTNGGSSSTAAPSPTLYVKNIEGKVKKPELRRQLHSLFSTYGRVLDIVATRAPSMRGQAFIVFDSSITSTAAKRGLSGFSFYGKELHIDYSTGEKSKALLRRELGEEAVLEMDFERSRTTVSRRGEKRVLLGDGHNDENEEDDDHAGLEEVKEGEGEESSRKRVKRDGQVVMEAIVNAVGIPNSIEQEVISALFSRQDGYLSVSTSHPKKEEDGQDESWSASIKFENRESAQAAKDKLGGIQIDPSYTLDLSIL